MACTPTVATCDAALARLGKAPLDQTPLGPPSLGKLLLNQPRLGKAPLGQTPLGKPLLGQPQLGQLRLGPSLLG
jgi:hypothetical protein